MLVGRVCLGVVLLEGLEELLDGLLVGAVLGEGEVAEGFCGFVVVVGRIWCSDGA